MLAARQIRDMACFGAMVFIATAIQGNIRCNAQEITARHSETLESAVKMAGSIRAGFRLVGFRYDGVPGPKFAPVKGLDDPGVVPFLIDVLENGPSWIDEKLLKVRGGIHPHIARCYAALCLGAIGDQRAYDPLVKMLQQGDFLEDKFDITYNRRDRYHISDYAAVALGYLGDPRAVDPLITAMKESGREWAVYGLTRLRDTRAVKPIIEYALKNDRLDYMLHRCLEHISRAHFDFKYADTIRRCTIRQFPELGEHDLQSAYRILWRHWLKEGDRYAKRQFYEYYPKWERLCKERSSDRFSQGHVLFDMTRGGVAALPFIMVEIEKGDESLVLAVEFLKAGGPVDRSLDHTLPTDAGAECLQWWAENRPKWTVFDSR